MPTTLEEAVDEDRHGAASLGLTLVRDAGDRQEQMGYNGEDHKIHRATRRLTLWRTT